jgi:hypothetical protein
VQKNEKLGSTSHKGNKKIVNIIKTNNYKYYGVKGVFEKDGCRFIAFWTIKK